MIWADWFLLTAAIVLVSLIVFVVLGSRHADYLEHSRSRALTEILTRAEE